MQDLHRGYRRYYVQVKGPDGHIVSKAFANPNDALDFEYQMRRQRDRQDVGETPIIKVIRIDDYAAQWLSERKEYRPKATWLKDEQRLNKHIIPKFGKRILSSVCTRDFEIFLDGLVLRGMSPATRNRIRALLHSMYEAAINSNPKHAFFNPVSPIKQMAEIRQEENYWSDPEHIESYIRQMEHLGDVWGVLASILSWLGARVGEALGLKWEDIDYLHNRVGVRRIMDSATNTIQERTKTNRGKNTVLYLPLFPRLETVLREWHAVTPHNQPQNFIVSQPDGSPMTYWRVEKPHKMAITRARLPYISIHGLRHTFASTLASKSLSMAEISKLLGHTNLHTTGVYTHLKLSYLVQKAKTLGFGVLPTEKSE